jgi:hypothetical protein
MNTLFGVILFLWVVGWSIAAIRAVLKTPPATDHCRNRTEYRTGLRLTN